MTGFLSQWDLAWSINRAQMEPEACLLPLETKKENPCTTSMSIPALTRVSLTQQTCRKVSTAVVSLASRGSGGTGKRSKETPFPPSLRSRSASSQVSGYRLVLRLDMQEQMGARGGEALIPHLPHKQISKAPGSWSRCSHTQTRDTQLPTPFSP